MRLTVSMMLAVSLVVSCCVTAADTEQDRVAKRLEQWPGPVRDVALQLAETRVRCAAGPEDLREQDRLCRELYALGETGHRFLVEGVADPFWHNRIAIGRGLGVDSFHVQSSGLRFRFVDVQAGGRPELEQAMALLNENRHEELSEEIEAALSEHFEAMDGQYHLHELTALMEEYLVRDTRYLDRFIAAWSPGNAISMEECVDELTDPRSTLASRRIAWRFLETYENLKLDYNPTTPVEATPPEVVEALKGWKQHHYEGSWWQRSDQQDEMFEVLDGGAPLNITEEQVPDPEGIPFADHADIDLYLKHYKEAYLEVANTQGRFFRTLCFAPRAATKGRYDGMREAREARRKAARAKYESMKRLLEEAHKPPPSLGISREEIPEPKDIPFEAPADAGAFKRYYRMGYRDMANATRGYLIGRPPKDTPYWQAASIGYYRGQRDALGARKAAACESSEQR